MKYLKDLRGYKRPTSRVGLGFPKGTFRIGVTRELSRI
jgi:hypothetical protein